MPSQELRHAPESERTSCIESVAGQMDIVEKVLAHLALLDFNRSSLHLHALMAASLVHDSIFNGTVIQAVLGIVGGLPKLGKIFSRVQYEVVCDDRSYLPLPRRRKL